MNEFKEFSDTSKLYAEHYGLIKEAEEEFSKEFGTLITTLCEKFGGFEGKGWEVWVSTSEMRWKGLNMRKSGLQMYLGLDKSGSGGVVKSQLWVSLPKERQQERPQKVELLGNIVREIGFSSEKHDKNIDLMEAHLLEKCHEMVKKFTEAVERVK